jgi:hypothetical protein
MKWYNPATWFKAGDKGIGAAVDTVADIRSAIDVLILTKEEKIQYSQKGMDQFLEFQKLNMEQNSERSKARRDIAWLIVQAQLLQLFVIGTAWLINKEWAEFLLKLNMALKVGAAFFAVVIFYFGYYGVQGAIDKYKKK